MPRQRAAAVIQEAAIQDEALPGLGGLPQDPQPTRRPPGRPKGSVTKKTAGPKIAARGADGRVMSKAQIKQQVADELYGFASMFIGIWGMRDPECAGVWTDDVHMPGGGVQERLAAIVAQTVEILARNDKVLSVLATGGVIGQIGMLGHLLVPPCRQILAAHGPGGHGHRTADEVNGYADKYPAPALA